MRHSSMALLATAALALSGGASAQGKKPVLASWEDTKYKEVVPGVSKAVLWGDPEKGAYGAFTKFAPGQTNALHTHSTDVRMVVLKGAYIYRPEGGDEKRVAAGSFLMVPGGARHVSMGDAKEGAVLYEEADGKFDLKIVDKKN